MGPSEADEEGQPKGNGGDGDCDKQLSSLDNGKELEGREDKATKSPPFNRQSKPRETKVQARLTHQKRTQPGQSRKGQNSKDGNQSSRDEETDKRQRGGKRPSIKCEAEVTPRKQRGNSKASKEAKVRTPHTKERSHQRSVYEGNLSPH